MRAALLFLLLLLALPSIVSAQTEADGWAPPDVTQARPTSGAPSLRSGRTLGTGEVLLAAGAGWPGAWAELVLAPDSALNLGIRLGGLYGSPTFGLTAGAGAEAQVPIRIHVFGEHDIDVALTLTPELAVGEGRLFGEQASATRAGALGWSTRADAGAVVGWRATDAVTLLAGASVGAGVSATDAPMERVRALGVAYATLGVEGLLARDTLLFAVLEVGGGLADGSGRALAYYPDPALFRLWVGAAYLP